MNFQQYKLTQHEIGYIDHLLKSDKEWLALTNLNDIEEYRDNKLIEAQLDKVTRKFQPSLSMMGYDSMASLILSKGRYD